MITPKCPRCGAAIQGDDVNVARDVAYCRPCNLAHELSALLRAVEQNDGVDLRHPPAGAWHRKDATGTVIGATHRSPGAAAATFGISLFWNGIVSLFVLVAMAGTLRHLDVTPPAWFPAPEMNGGDMGVGMTIFLWLFLTPFILIGLVLMGAFLSCLGGRTEVRFGGSGGCVFTGIGPLGWSRRFDPRAVKAVRIDDQRWRDSDGDRRRNTRIVIETREGRLINFGSHLSEERRKFVAAAARKALVR
jgi:hypothetical protein